MKRIGILFHPKVEKSERFARDIADFLKSKGLSCWIHSSWDEGEARKALAGSDLVISVGGDGTILRAARIIYPQEIPVLGVNFGNLGFMNELEAGEARDKLVEIIGGAGWIEQRSVLKAVILSSGKTYHALNDVVVGRGRFMRLINVEVAINGEVFTTYRADAVIVSTATGSTGYSLAANGPILYPESHDIMMKAVCPHLNMDKAIVLAPSTRITLKAFTNHEAMISMDGQVEEMLKSGDQVEVCLAEQTSRFLRLRPRGSFYSTLVSKLKGKSL
ncbi:MAG: NAD(+)/NADH kinase [Dehalococcoidia bacterium]